ncbi:MAG: lipopolysaccharide heptosyltransferase II [Methylophilaceae bacterium]|nr:lipopolysaccharide heptosyltransferase II [Methylophilaceae bacterium]MDG1454249.1 lipopolysaccharide heptosyltransferase II [Methylophilaceae bacterium]
MSSEKILVMGPSWVGDMVMAHSLFQLLKQQNPDVQIDIAAPAWTLPLLDRMPEVSEKIALPFKHGQLSLMERVQFGRCLKDNNYTQSISLVNSLKSAILPFAASIKKRTGFLGEMRYGLLNDIRPLDKKALPKTVERFVTLGLPKNQPLPAIPQPILLADKENAVNVLTQINTAVASDKVLGLCPGAEYGEAKRWPANYVAEVANAALDQGWQVLLFGSDKDVPVTQAINQMTQSRCIDLGGKTKLGDAIDIMSLCTTVISNDSGLMHIAAALNIKLIAIYGSSDPHHTPPMHPDAIVEYLALSCSPCFKRVCPLQGEAHMACLNKIRPTTVFNKVSA